MYASGIKEIILQLLKDRETASEAGEYEQLTEIRDKIEFLRDKARELMRCEEVKQLAIEHEDYDVAKALKIKIENDKRLLQ